MSKKFLIGLLIGEFLVVFAIGSGGVCLLRRDEQIAFRNWFDHPSDATQAEVARQQEITRGYNLAFAGILFLVMVVPTGFIYWRNTEHGTVDLLA